MAGLTRLEAGMVGNFLLFIGNDKGDKSRKRNADNAGGNKSSVPPIHLLVLLACDS
jgi:hypothetical protein